MSFPFPFSLRLSLHLPFPPAARRTLLLAGALVVVFAVGGVGLAPEARAGWKLVVMKHQPDFDSAFDRCTGLGHQTGCAVYAEALASASAYSLTGDGYAFDEGMTQEALAKAVALGLYFETHTHVKTGPGDQVGEVEYEGSVAVEGFAELIDADCAAAAFAYAELQVQVGASVKTIHAELTRSAASTSSEQVASLLLGFPVRGLSGGLTLPVRVGTHLGRSPDKDADVMPLAVVCPASSFTVRTKTRSYVYVWANSSLFEAESKAHHWGWIEESHALLSWPECP